jgi:hypothetical protein
VASDPLYCEENFSYSSKEVINILDDEGWNVEKEGNWKPKTLLARCNVGFTPCLTVCSMFSIYPSFERRDHFQITRKKKEECYNEKIISMQ